MQGVPAGVPLGAVGASTPAQSSGAVTATPVVPQTQEALIAAQAAPPGALAHMMGPPPQPQHITVERGCQKKTRLVWTQELHMRFLAAVEKIGLRTAVPRTILQVMDVEGLTRENIASHLQKYRRLLEKKAGISGPVSSKDWPKLEAVQTQHLQSLRKQVSESQDAGTSSAAAAAEPAAAQPGPAAPPAAIRISASDAAAASGSDLVAPLDLQSTPPPVPQTPPSADLPADQIPGIETMWQDLSQASAPAPCMPAATMPLPQAPQLQAPGVCPVHPREPPSVPVPLGPDADGHTLGVPMPQSILPPFMCVMPQYDSGPTLLPMLPAMYLAACGKNTPDTMGTVSIQHSQMPGMMGGVGPHPAAPMMPMPMHHAQPYGMPMPGGMPYPMPMPHGPTMAAGAGQPMFPGFSPPMMPMPAMHRDAMAMPPDASGHPSQWRGMPAWRPPHGKPATQTLPPLTADHPPPRPLAMSHPADVPAAPPSGSGEAMPRTNSFASGQPGSVGEEGSGGAGAGGVASNAQGIANIKLESDPDPPAPPDPVGVFDAAFDGVDTDAEMAIDGDDMGWPGWPDASSTEDIKPDLGLGPAVSSAAEDPMTDAFADILGSPQQQAAAVGLE
eukprot:jgi/Ulvmu1/5227/UM022_0020.1